MTIEFGGHKCSVCEYGYFGVGSLDLKRECSSQTIRKPNFEAGNIVTRWRYRKRETPPKYRISSVEITHGEKQTLDRKSVVSHVYLCTIVLLSNTSRIHKVFEEDLIAVK